MATNPFAKYAQGYQSDPIIAPADPYKQAAEGRAQEDQVRQNAQFGLQQQQFQYQQQKDAAELATKEKEAADKAAKFETARTSSIANLTDVINKIDSVGQQAINGWFDTGRGGAFVRGLPDAVSAGTDAYNLKANLGKIDATGAFSTLQAMREASPTGGALGAVSDTELGLLKSSVANLDPNQSEGQFLNNLDEARNVYLRMLERLDPEAAKALARKEAPAVDQDEGLQVQVTDDSPAAPGSTPPTGGAPQPPTNGTTLGDISTLAQQGVTLGLSDEAAGLGGYLSGFLTGRDPQAEYTRSRDAERARIAQARERSPVLGTLGEFLGGGGAARIASVPNALAGVVRQGAALGGVGGFGYGEGNGSVGNAFAGAALGGGLGAGLYGIGRGASALAARRAGPAPTSEQAELIAAGERQGIPLRQPDVRPEMRNGMAQAETTETGGPLIRQSRADDAALIEQRVGGLASDGVASDPFALGTQVQDAGRRYIANTRQQASRLYDTARNEAQGASVQPAEALAAIDQNIAELQAAGENTNAGQINYLQQLRSDLDRPLTVEAVQNLRTNMRGQLSGQGLTGTDAERRVSQVIDAANRDLVRDLPQNASNALRAADDFYRQRQTFINDTLNQLMGSRNNPLPAETAANRLVSMTKGTGNYRRFSAMWQQLEPTEQADVAATVAESLGRKRNGEFSPSTLVQSLDPNKGINPRTARLIFGDEGARALTDLRAIARAKTDTQNALNNSRTGTAVNAAAGGLKGLLMGALGFSQGGVVGAVAAPVATRFLSSLGERRTAALLLNPDFTAWLRNAPNSTNPRVIDRYFSRISGKLAANDNEALRKAFMDAFTASPATRVAASEQDQDVRREPVQ